MYKPRSSRVVFACPIFKVEETEVALLSGSTATHWYVVMPDWVGELCFRNGRVLLLKEFRSGSQSWDLGIVAGQVEEGETPEAAAAREVKEETGLQPLELQPLITFRHASPFIKMKRYLFQATQFRDVGRPEEGIAVQELDPVEVEGILNPFELTEPREVYKALRDAMQGRQTGL